MHHTCSWLCCATDAGGDKADKDTLAPCVMLMIYYSMTLGESGRSIEAVSIARRAVEIAADFGVESEISLLANFFSTSWCSNGRVKHGRAEAPFRIALAGAEKLLANDPALAAYVAQRANNPLMLGHYIPIYTEALTLRLCFYGETSNFTGLAYSNVGLVLMETGQLAEAHQMFSRVLAVQVSASMAMTAARSRRAHPARCRHGSGLYRSLLRPWSRS